MRTLLALVLVSMVAIGAAQDIAKSTRIVAWTMWLCHQPKAITLTIWSIECHGDVFANNRQRQIDRALSI